MTLAMSTASTIPVTLYFSATTEAGITTTVVIAVSIMPWVENTGLGSATVAEALGLVVT